MLVYLGVGPRVQGFGLPGSYFWWVIIKLVAIKNRLISSIQNLLWLRTFPVYLCICQAIWFLNNHQKKRLKFDFSTWEKDHLQNAAPCFGPTHERLAVIQAYAGLLAQVKEDKEDSLETVWFSQDQFHGSACSSSAPGRTFNKRREATEQDCNTGKSAPCQREIGLQICQSCYLSKYLGSFLPRLCQKYTKTRPCIGEHLLFCNHQFCYFLHENPQHEECKECYSVLGL